MQATTKSSSSNEPLVIIDNISKTFDPLFPPALQNISSNIPKGQMVGLAGPDGAGKTTLIRLIAGLLLPSQGKITVDTFDTIRDATSIHNIIGYMPQRFGLYEDLTVIQNLNLYADLKGLPTPERPDTYKKLLAFTALQPFTQRLAGNLSGGMKQKLGLACALIRNPTLLLLDEPSVGVDPISRRELWSMVHDLLAEGISVVWSTAYLDEAEKCDNVILLNEGKLLYQGTPKQLCQRVDKRTFQITNITDNRRQILSHTLQQDNVIDGIIQGSNVRFVTKTPPNTPFDNALIHLNSDLNITPTSPRFEDAFIDILGGGPGGRSVLAEKTPTLPNTGDFMVEADALTKKFGDFTAANNISFKIPRGEIFGLLGPNGAGKSTIFKMMCGLLKPTSGKAFVGGLDLQVAPSQGRAHVGYMAQKFSLYGNLSVQQNLDFFAGIYNLQGAHKREMTQEMIEIFNLHEFLNVNAEALPLGYKQRLALSCSVMHHPQVLFLDEPTSGVDPITRREFWNHINGLVEKGVTVMVTTHFMDEAEYCDRIALIYHSQIINIGTPDALKDKAKTPTNLTPTLEEAFIDLIEQYDVGKNHVS